MCLVGPYLERAHACGHVTELRDDDDRVVGPLAPELLGELGRAHEREIERARPGWRAVLDRVPRALEQLDDLGAQAIAGHVDEDPHPSSVLVIGPADSRTRRPSDQRA
jgi:hypothetical protein